MIDRTEQERLLIIFHCAEKYYDTKGSIYRAAQSAYDVLEATRSHSAQRREVRDIDV